MKSISSDIVVVGTGIAGISAAIETTKANKNTVLISSGKFCSGASFYPGTWGLGMVVAEDEKDKKDFVDTIMNVGCGIPNEKLVTTLIENAESCIKDFMNLGIKFRRPIDGETVIPCFDKNPRKWYGFDFKTARMAFSKLKEDKNLNVLENTNLIKIIKDEKDSFSSAIFITDEGEYIQIFAKAIIIATGGFTNIYKYNLSTEDMALNAHIPAVEVGCKLTNMEFIQFIPAYITPHYKTIFNERVFNHITLKNKNEESILKDNLPDFLTEKEVLKERSTHGPFTSRLNSKYVDISMFKEYLKSKEGIRFTYPKDILNIKDTLIFNYFKWLEEKGALDDSEIIIIPFAHAANGGIDINEKAETSIKGIYSAGEVTGGVHGADRIGGLSTVNAMVFGKIAGEESVKYIDKKEIEKLNTKEDIEKYFIEENNSVNEVKNYDLEEKITYIRELMYNNASIIRKKKDIKNTIKTIENIESEFNIYNYLHNLQQSKKAFVLRNYIKMSKVVLNSILNRENSLGSHYIED